MVSAKLIRNDLRVIMPLNTANNQKTVNTYHRDTVIIKKLARLYRLTSQITKKSTTVIDVTTIQSTTGLSFEPLNTKASCSLFKYFYQ